jgi:hypothetical protein
VIQNSLHKSPSIVSLAVPQALRRKIRAYHAHMMAGIIAQGLLQYLSLSQTKLVWKSFGSWFRTIRPGVLPSEQVVAITMRNVIPVFLGVSEKEQILAQFIREKIDIERSEGIALVACQVGCTKLGTQKLGTSRYGMYFESKP